MDLQAKAFELKTLLLKIYRCKKDFELLVIDKKPKTRAGVYIIDSRRIRVYAKWQCSMSLEEIGVRKESRDLISGGFFLLFVVKQFKRGYTLMILLQI